MNKGGDEDGEVNIGEDGEVNIGGDGASVVNIGEHKEHESGQTVGDACASSSSPQILRVNIASMQHNVQNNNELLYSPIYIKCVNKNQIVSRADKKTKDIPAPQDPEYIEDR